MVEAAAKAYYELDDSGVDTYALRAALQAALPLLLEQKGWTDAWGEVYLRREDAMDSEDSTPEPLYRLKVSNEQ